VSKTAAWVGIVLALLAFVSVFVGFALQSGALIAVGTLLLVALWITVASYRRQSGR
jgi:hypothetical protein